MKKKGQCTLWKNHHKAALVLFKSNANPLAGRVWSCGFMWLIVLPLASRLWVREWEGSSWMAVGVAFMANPYL